MYCLINCKWIISWFPMLVLDYSVFLSLLCLSMLMNFMYLFAELQLWLRAIMTFDLPNSLPLGYSHMVFHLALTGSLWPRRQSIHLSQLSHVHSVKSFCIIFTMQVAEFARLEGGNVQKGVLGLLTSVTSYELMSRLNMQGGGSTNKQSF